MPVFVLEVEQSLFMAPPHTHTFKHTRIRIVIADFYASHSGGALLLVSDVAHTPRCNLRRSLRVCDCGLVCECVFAHVCVVVCVCGSLL